MYAYTCILYICAVQWDCSGLTDETLSVCLFICFALNRSIPNANDRCVAQFVTINGANFDLCTVPLRRAGSAPHRPALTLRRIGARLCVCLPARLRACVHACVRACVPVCTRACAPACVSACLPARLRACVHACVRACVRVCLRACVRASVCVCVRVCLAGLLMWTVKSSLHPDAP